MLLNDGPATTEKLVRTFPLPIVYATPAISGRTRRRAKSPSAPDGLRTSARNQLNAPAGPQPRRGLSRTSGPMPKTEFIPSVVGFTYVTDAPTLTRPSVCAVAIEVEQSSKAATGTTRFIWAPEEDSRPRRDGRE